MTKYYLKFNTMKHIIDAPANCSVDETLRTICKAEEIACIYLLYSKLIFKLCILVNVYHFDNERDTTEA